MVHLQTDDQEEQDVFCLPITKEGTAAHAVSKVMHYTLTKRTGCIVFQTL
jgi:hypothetical protein